MRALVRGLVVLLVASHAVMAQPKTVDPLAALPAAPTGKLVVGTIPVAPFIIKNDDGSWGGISMDLWKEVARRAEARLRDPRDAGRPISAIPRRSPRSTCSCR